MRYPRKTSIFHKTDETIVFQNCRFLDISFSNDSLILISAEARDASGNAGSISQIKLLGDDLHEKELGFSATPVNIEFTSQLEETQIIPSIEFQFRGLTPVNGLYPIDYESSDPSKVIVTPQGLVYPIAETNSPVMVHVKYEDHDVEIPVTVNFSKSIVNLAFADAAEQEAAGVTLTDGQWVLPSLNKAYPAPVLNAVFDDGSSSVLNSGQKTNLLIPEGAASLFNWDSRSGLKGLFEVSAENPVQLILQLQSQPNIRLAVPVSVLDAKPNIKLTLVGSANPGKSLRLFANASDDDALTKVSFFVDGYKIGEVEKAPFEMQFPITESMLGSELHFTAQATDSKGQVQVSAEQVLGVSRQTTATAPLSDFVLPAINQHIVESSQYTAQVEVNLGDDKMNLKSSGIRSVEFYVEGLKVASSQFGYVEPRVAADEKTYYYEIWNAKARAPEIATAELVKLLLRKS